MDRLNSYALTATVGVGATTISAALVGDPIPVVIPAAVAAVAIGGHHLRYDRADDVDQEDVDDVDPAGDRKTAVETIGGGGTEQ